MSAPADWRVLLPIALYLLAVFAIGAYAAKRYAAASRTPDFVNDYFLGGRELGGFLLAMTMAATYGSASSFLGGPGTAYTLGFGWVLLASSQVVTGYFVLLILGKKFAILARRFRAVTLVDFLRHRYDSRAVVVLAALAMIAFLFASMSAQWVGGGRLIESLTGLSYTASLVVFALCVLVYVLIGGFRAVAIADALQGIIMVIGTLVLLGAVVYAGGGIEAIVADLIRDDPALVTPFGPGGQLSIPYVSSFWILVGVGVVGLPQMAVRAMSYKTAKGMHRAIWIGTLVTGVIMICMHLTGILARPLMPDLAEPDTLIPRVALQVLPPWLAGLVLAAPLAAIMSTVDALLLVVASALVKDLYINYVRPDASERRMKRLSFGVTAALGAAVFLSALQPPALLVFLNLFAFGGLEAAFIWPVVLGLYWKWGNARGALASMATGVVSYVAIHFYNEAYGNLFGVHTVTLPVLASLVAYVAGSLWGKRRAFEF